MSKEALAASLELSKRPIIEAHHVLLGIQVITQLVDLFANRSKSAKELREVAVLRNVVLKKIRALKAAHRNATPTERRRLDRKISALLSLVTED